MQPQPARRQHPIARSRYLPYLIVGGAVGLGFVLMIGAVAFVALLMLANPRLPEGVTVAGINIGGDTPEQAAAALAPLNQAQITFTDSDRQWRLSLADIGVSVNPEQTLALAGKASSGAALQPSYQIDMNQAQTGLTYLSTLANITGDSRTAGRAMDIPVTLSRLNADLNGELADGLLELDMMVVEPVAPEAGQAYTGMTTTHIVEAAQELGLIAKLYGVSVQDIVTLNSIANADLIYPGQELLIPAAGVYEPTQADAPAPSTTSGKAIVVSVSTQRIYAFENGTLIRSHLVSTGRAETPTVLGDYAIQRKYVADDMAGPGYFLPQVPHAMYFFQGYAIHGTYWHNNFGRPMSHGCVNLPSDESGWWFQWAEMGTPVRVVA
jgi:lipoprotein-anchoring transpeptidase ErfK/SrfK